jgi:type III pantothenate kinase
MKIQRQLARTGLQMQLLCNDSMEVRQLLFGYVALVEGMVERFRLELGNDMRVIATGGLAEILAVETEVLEVVAPWLTLDGLRMIWDMNR